MEDMRNRVIRQQYVCHKHSAIHTRICARILHPDKFLLFVHRRHTSPAPLSEDGGNGGDVLIVPFFLLAFGFSRGRRYCTVTVNFSDAAHVNSRTPTARVSRNYSAAPRSCPNSLPIRLLGRYSAHCTPISG